MPDKKWKERLEERTTMDPKDLARLNYRVARKIKSSLSELADINHALCSIPEKNARRVLDDRMVADIFKLTVNMMRILGYSPVEEGPNGIRVVTRSERVIYRDDNSKKVETLKETPNDDDMARHFLLKEHLEKLQKFANPEIREHIELNGNVYCGPKGFQSDLSQAGYNKYKKWIEPK
jgi:hypothetical protein